jgi:uncharacterized protein (TIGR02270 family)
MVTSAETVDSIVFQHAEEAASLFSTRVVLREMPHVSLDRLLRLDQRLVAHLDGLAVAGDRGWSFCEAGLEDPSAGAVFTAAVRALEETAGEKLMRVLAVAEAFPETIAGLNDGLEWVERRNLQGIVVDLLDAPRSFRRMIGVTACGVHRVDPGLADGRLVHDADPLVRARALRTAGEVGGVSLASTCTEAIEDENLNCRLWAAWSALLLGDDSRPLEVLKQAAITDSSYRSRAFGLSLQAMRLNAAHALLQALTADPQQLRWIIRGSGINGDPAYLPFLINHMGDTKTARLGGESFSLITGIDLFALNLDRPQPEDFESGPNDDADDPNVEVDPDDGLPWPDPDKVEKWWTANAGRFQRGQRYFMGAPVTREHCLDVLKNGFQRQRVLAAQYLCLLEPGTPLFNTSAPAWRQQRLLAKMS